MRPYPHYKPSGVPWLGVVPGHWNVERLRFRVKLNPSFSKPLSSDLPVSFLPMEAIGDDGSLDLERTRLVGEVASGYTYFEEGDVTIAKITPCYENGKGAVMRGLLEGAGFGTTELIVMRPIQTNIPEWLYYLTMCSAFRLPGEALMQGAGGQKRVPELFVKDYFAPIPPEGEQRAIADYLDAETARIDILIREKDELIGLLWEWRQSVIAEAVTKGVNKSAAMKPSGVPWLGDVPAHWSVEKLKFFVGFAGGGTPSKDNPEYWEGSIPWVSPKDMKRPRISETEDYITAAGQMNSPCTLIPPLSVLTVVRSGILQHSIPVALNTVPVTLNQDMKALLPTERANSRFLAYQISGCQKELREEWVKQGATVESIEHQRMADSELGLPPVTEQQAIAEYLDAETAKIDDLIDHTNDEITLLKELRAATIVDAVLGRIDVRTLQRQ